MTVVCPPDATDPPHGRAALGVRADYLRLPQIARPPARFPGGVCYTGRTCTAISLPFHGTTGPHAPQAPLPRATVADTTGPRGHGCPRLECVPGRRDHRGVAGPDDGQGARRNRRSTAVRRRRGAGTASRASPR